MTYITNERIDQLIAVIELDLMAVGHAPDSISRTDAMACMRDCIAAFTELLALRAAVRELQTCDEYDLDENYQTLLKMVPCE